MREIIIKSTDEKNIVTLLEDYNVVEKYEEDKKKQRIEGNIYLGKIQRVLPGLQAVFVDIGNNKNAFYILKILCQKLAIVQEIKTKTLMMLILINMLKSVCLL